MKLNSGIVWKSVLAKTMHALIRYISSLNGVTFLSFRLLRIYTLRLNLCRTIWLDIKFKKITNTFETYGVKQIKKFKVQLFLIPEMSLDRLKMGQKEQ